MGQGDSLAEQRGAWAMTRWKQWLSNVLFIFRITQNRYRYFGLVLVNCIDSFTAAMLLRAMHTWCRAMRMAAGLNP